MDDVYVIMDLDTGHCCGVYSDYLGAAHALIDFLIRQDFFEPEEREEMEEELLYANDDLCAEWYGFAISCMPMNTFTIDCAW